MTKLRNLLVLTAASFFLLGSFIGCKKNSESPAPTPEETKTLESISLEVSPATLKVGEKANLKVTATYSDKSTADVSEKAVFTSSDKSVATCEGTRLTAVKEGSADIIASYTEGEKTVSSTSVAVKVEKADTPAPTPTPQDPENPNPEPKPEERTLSAIVLSSDPSFPNLEEGKTATLKVTAKYSDGTSEDVTEKATMTSSSESTATVKGATLTAVKAGETTVQAAYKEGGSEEKRAEIKFTVRAKGSEKPKMTLESLDIGGDFSLEIGKTKDITVKAKYKEFQSPVDVTQAATYHSSAPDNADFDKDSKNRLVAKEAIETPLTITVNYEDPDKNTASATASVTVTQPAKKTLESIKLSVSESDPFSLAVGESKDLKVTATYSDKSTADISSLAKITSESDNVTVAGTKVTGVSAGEAKVTATYEEKTDSITFTVTGTTIKVTVPDWTWNDGTKVFVWGWNENSGSENKDGSWVEASGAGEKSTTVTFPVKNGWTYFLLTRCQKDTTEPKWDITDRKSNAPGRIYNKTKDVKIEKDKTEYSLTDSDFSDYPLVSLKVILDSAIESGNSIYFTGTFEEARDSSGESWKMAVKGTNGGGDGKTWTCDVTIPRASNTFEWKAMKGNTIDNKTTTTSDNRLKWQSGVDNNNKYEEVKDSSGTITNITGDSVTNPNFN